MIKLLSQPCHNSNLISQESDMFTAGERLKVLKAESCSHHFSLLRIYLLKKKKPSCLFSVFIAMFCFSLACCSKRTGKAENKTLMV